MNESCTYKNPLQKARICISEFYIALVITLLSISFWSTFVLYFRPIYKWAVSLFHIERSSGLSKQVMYENYNALINYYYPWVKGNLSLPSLPQSSHAIQHFAEVKDIFNLFLFIIPVTLILLLVYLWCKRGQKNLHFLKTASITMIAAPLVLGCGFATNFDKTFETFHKLFFDNDYWIFDPNTDPIINMLPEQFFMLCGIFIIGFVLLTSLFCFLLYKGTSRKGMD
ncbi:TIGR01906 family membrane protein [[Clostridium] polysaccharolyticum]|uniref:Integral membrane protein TIGR01906 n=1 Tax=[Clostridium] polysaccharolyticum TaxID=29364 RepID=A0A1I0G5X9_9FIRM|nr:TIGR01906 family membrane protein [[Clostridium] polysaccharolyticum]SET65457.1 integral membrane protein TIGR01906 [[Clostridium] polysaccharolyticum]